jgi:hypothetical protein
MLVNFQHMLHAGPCLWAIEVRIYTIKKAKFTGTVLYLLSILNRHITGVDQQGGRYYSTLMHTENLKTSKIGKDGMKWKTGDLVSYLVL